MTRRTRVWSLFGDAPCVILSAPAGFGKTTVVRSALARPGHGVPGRAEWVELGTAFRTDAATVACGLATALCQLGVDPGAFESVEPSESLDAGSVDRIQVALAAVEGNVTLVFDDFHRVGAALASQLAAIFVPWCDHRRRVIVCTRMARSEFAAAWPIHEASFVAGPHDLLFEAEEIADVLGPALEAHVESVLETTGGWPRAVELMRRYLEIDSNDGFDRAITELESMICAEVLPLHDPTDRDLLTAVALCERFTAGVADRATRRTGSAQRLLRLAKETGLVRCEGSMFSLVPVYRRALVQWLQVTDPDAIGPTHARLADAWLDEPDSLDATIHAIEHLIEAGEVDRALELIRRQWQHMYRASRERFIADLIERLPMRCWADDAASVLLAGWANILSGRGARGLYLLQSRPLRTPVGAAIQRLVWSHGVWWTTAPAEAIQLIAEGRLQLDALDVEATFPPVPGLDSADAFRRVADAAEAPALFLLGDLAGSIERLDHDIEHSSQHRPASVAGLHAVAALVRAFRGDRREATEHLRISGAIARELGSEHHYLMAPGHLAAAVLSMWDADDETVQSSLQEAVDCASSVDAANLLRVCELVADLAGHRFCPPDDTILERAARLPFVDSQLAVRTARRLVDLGDHDAAVAMIRGVRPNELRLSSWVHVLLARHTPAEVRDWLASQPPPTCAHGEVVRFLAEATVAEEPEFVVGHVRSAVALASDRRMVAVVADAPAAMWEREEIRRLELPLLDNARRRLRDGVRRPDGLQFTVREIELLRLIEQSATASETAGLRSCVSARSRKRCSSS